MYSNIKRLLLFFICFAFLIVHTGCIGPLYVMYEFLLKEEAPEESNASPVVSVDQIGRQYNAGAIPVNFTVSDPEGDSCKITVYYSVAGSNWTKCTGIPGLGGKLQAPKGGKAYSRTWDATGDLGVSTVQDVRIAVQADDGDDKSRRAVSDTFIPGNDGPSVTISEPASIEAGNIIIEYTVSDPAADSVSLVCEYSTDNITYVPMTIAAGETSNITTSTGGETHTIVWGSNSNIPGVNEGTVWVKIQASDGAPASGEDTTDSSFQVQNNASTPIAILTPFTRSFPADIQIDYKLVDTDGGTGDITPRYSEDGTNWFDATEKTGAPSEGTTNLSMSPTGDMHIYVWDSAADIGGGLKTDVYFRIIPDDGGGPGVSGDAGPFSIGNGAPTADITDPTGTQSGNVVINYTLTDSTDDDCTVTFQYGETPTGPWSDATPAIGTNPESDVSAKSGGSGHTYVWDSSTDYPNTGATVYFKIIAEDGGALTGNHVSASFVLDNTTTNSAPVVVISTISRQYNAVIIPINFNLSDAESDPCDITVYYQVAGGGWIPCTGITGSTTGLVAPPGGQNHSVTWDATGDIGSTTVLDVEVSIIANDGTVDSLRSISDIFISGNDAPSITITEPAPVESGNIIIEYTVSDAASDEVSLVCEYSTDGTTYSAMAIAAGETSNITTSIGGEVHKVVWGSNSDIPNINEGTVWVKIQASDGEPATGEDVTDSSFQVHNNASTPIAILTPFTRSFPADVQIDYKLVDSDGGTGDITPKYSEDGTNWFDATEKTGAPSEGTTNLSMSANGDMHIYVWDSAADIGGGLKTGVYFRIIPIDGGGPGVSGDTGPFSIGNDAPGVDIADPAGTQSGNIVINYTLTDSTDDDCTVTFQHGESATGPWSDATPAIGTNPETDVSAKSGGSGHTYVWDSSTDYPNTGATVYFKIIAEDGGALTGNHVSASFVLDNTTTNSAPVVVISSISRQYNAVIIPINFNLSDAESDPCDITVYCQVAGGGWIPCTGITGSTTGLVAPPGGQNHSVTWDATGDIGSTTVLDVQVGIVANDGTVDSLRGESNAFISGNDAPAVNIVDPGAGQGGNIVIDYTLTDPASDTCTITVQYQIDGQPTWNNCTSASIIPNPQTGVASSAAGIDYSFMWESETDLGAVVVDVWVRVKADDAAPSTGFGVTTAAFNVDNVTANDPPSVTYISSLMVLNDTYGVAPIPYQISDPEEDVCSVTLEYSTDGGANWYACTEYPEKCSEGRSGLTSYKTIGEEKKGQHLFLWNSMANVSSNDELCNIRLRAEDSLGNKSGYVYKLIPVSNWTSVGTGIIETIDQAYGIKAIGDLNGDGYKEIVEANESGNFIRIFYGNSSGYTTPEITFAGDNIDSITTGDINGDGYTDVIYGNSISAPSTVMICYGSPTGHSEPEILSAGMGPSSVQTGDINGDGYDEIISTKVDYITISYGSFSGPKLPESIFLNDARQLKIGDINGDGYDDIICACTGSDSVAICYGSVTGHGAPQVVAVGDNPRIATGDLNGDGYDDIISANFNSNDITIMYGSGTGHGAPQTIPAGDEPLWPSIGDLNGDGCDDIICANSLSDDITISYGSPTGHMPPVTIPAGDNPRSITAGDLNGDGYDDIVCANQDSNNVIVSYGSSLGHGTPKTILQVDSPDDVAAVDLNGDGYDDIVSQDKVVYGGSAGHQQTPETIQAGDLPVSVTTGDVNRDGFMDIVCMNYYSEDLTVTYGSKTGQGLPQLIAVGGRPHSVAMGDINGDGYAEIMCANGFTHDITISYGSDTGHGAPQTISAGNGPECITTGDINGDGYNDIVCLTGDISINYGSSSGHGATQFISIGGSSPKSLTTGDINGDGYDDIAAAFGGSDYIAIVYGSATGHGAPQTIVNGEYPISITMGDINGDGYYDIVCGNAQSDDITISYGSPTGHMPPETIPAGNNPRSITSGDINGDGYDDIVCLNRASDDLTIIYGNASGYGESQTVPVGESPMTVSTGDINGDGYDDIVCPNAVSYDISIVYGSPSGNRCSDTVSKGTEPRCITAGDINGDGHIDLVCCNELSDDMTLVFGETACKGFAKEVDTSLSDYTLEQKTYNIKIIFSQDSFLSTQETTLWLSSTSIKIPHPSIGTTWQKPIKASFPWDLMEFDVELETGKSATMTISFMPNISDERLKWADFRLYRYGWGVDRFDPRDDVVEIVASTEGGTLVVDPINRVATTAGAGNITKFGKYQIFQVTEDSDNDKLPDAWEVYYFGNITTTAGGVGEDQDGDTIDDIDEYYKETDPTSGDTDGDGYTDDFEINNGFDPTNPMSVHIDSDEDNMSDEWEILNFTDLSHDGKADNDEGTGDGLMDMTEYLIGTDPTVVDTSGDGDNLIDAWENYFFGDLTQGDAGDSDTDTETNLQEQTRGTDPTNPDTDFDALTDGVETDTGTYIDSNDTGTDPLDPDTDNDMLRDIVEKNGGTYISFQNTGTNPNTVDYDSDTYEDGWEVFNDYDPCDGGSHP